MSERIKLLKVKFDKTTLEEASEKCMNWAKGREKKYATTPNPEIVLEANKNPKYLKILNKSNLNIADGIGILWGVSYAESVKKSIFKSAKTWKFIKTLLCIPFNQKKLKRILPERVTGVDLMLDICRKSAKRDVKIFLLGAGKNIANKTKEILKKKYPKIQITGTLSGSPDKKEEKAITEKINKSEAEILFVAFGAPKQEIWIYKNLRNLKTVKLAIGIGGTFDFISGKRKRAPKILRTLGLEWLFRLLQQPSRFKRIYNATIKFAGMIAKKY